MSPGTAVWPLDREPELVAAAPPSLAPAQAAAIDAERARFRRTGAFTDGPLLMARSARPDRLAVFPATYAWHTVDRETPLRGTLGAVGVQLAVLSDSGPLWQLRGDRVEAPGRWSVSAAGAAVPGVPLERQVTAEAREELGLHPADMLWLRPLAIVISRPRRVVEVVYTARLRSGAVPRPDGVEAVEVRATWDPSDLPGPLDPLTHAWSGELRRLLAGQAGRSAGRSARAPSAPKATLARAVTRW